MRIPTRKRRFGLQFNITPLIDIVFLLVIFFLVATHFVRSETLVEVDLPIASREQETESEAAPRLVVTITADEQLHVGGNVVDLLAVEQMILIGADSDPQTFEVRVRADRTVPFREVEPILLACARAGVGNLKFAVNPQGR